MILTLMQTMVMISADVEDGDDVKHLVSSKNICLILQKQFYHTNVACLQL